MSKNQLTKLRKAGARIFPAPRRPTLKLLRPPSECLTTDLITELLQKVKELARVGTASASGDKQK